MLRVVLILIFSSLLAATALAQPEFVVAEQEVPDRKGVLGTVQSIDLIAARAQIGGTVRGLSVDEGSAVRAGQTIATVEDPKLALQIAAVDALIGSIDAQRNLAQVEYERLLRLRKSGTVSQARLDEAKANLTIVTGHWLFGAPFTATSMIEFIALAGIIVRNSILLVDFIRRERE